METTLVITDVTRMGAPRVCIAGITAGGRTIRPVLPYPGIQEDWLYDGDQAVIRPFARVTFDLINSISEPPHTEDWCISPNMKHSEGMASIEERRQVLQKNLSPDVPSIFEAEIYRNRGVFILEGEGVRSLGTIKPNIIQFVHHRDEPHGYSYKIRFIDESGGDFQLTVNDLSFRYYLDYLRTVENLSCGRIGLHLQQLLNEYSTYLRIGLTRGWNIDPHLPHTHCYLQITGVYSIPDYLDGRCFADFL
jgi:hypothetical protein